MRPVARVLLISVLLAAGAVRASEPEIARLMENYWRAFSQSQFIEAAQYLDPRDLEALRSGLLPMFLQASKSQNATVVPLVQSFFGTIPPDEREDMTPAQVFAGMNLMYRDVMPQVYEALRSTTIEVTGVEMAEDGTAIVRYRAKAPDREAEDGELANFHEGRWYLRAREAPEDTREKFRMLLGLDYETGPEVKLSPPDPG